MPTFRKLMGKHYHREVSGEIRVIRPGDTLDCEEGYIRRFDPNMKTWEEVTPERKKESIQETTTKKTAKPPEKAPEKKRATKLEIKESAKKGKYDVINPKTGNAINDKPLSKAEATALVSEDMK
jgi:hypothetical protein